MPKIPRINVEEMKVEEIKDSLDEFTGIGFTPQMNRSTITIDANSSAFSPRKKLSVNQELSSADAFANLGIDEFSKPFKKRSAPYFLKKH